MSVRKRNTEWIEGSAVGYDRAYHPEGECDADVDRGALLDAGDTLAAAAQKVVDGTPPGLRLTFGPYAHLRAAIDAWKATVG